MRAETQRALRAPTTGPKDLTIPVWRDDGVLDKERSREVRRNIRRILMSGWDPIGVCDIPDAALEYDGYTGGVDGLLERGASAAYICAYLRDIEVNRMELVDAYGQPLLAEAERRAVASSLNALREYFA
jgi:hypothetical protein